MQNVTYFYAREPHARLSANFRSAFAECNKSQSGSTSVACKIISLLDFVFAQQNKMDVFDSAKRFQAEITIIGLFQG
jgi:hypothetical protein